MDKFAYFAQVVFSISLIVLFYAGLMAVVIRLIWKLLA
jgi:hypothetical protein